MKNKKFPIISTLCVVKKLLEEKKNFKIFFPERSLKQSIITYVGHFWYMTIFYNLTMLV